MGQPASATGSSPGDDDPNDDDDEKNDEKSEKADGPKEALKKGEAKFAKAKGGETANVYILCQLSTLQVGICNIF